MELHIHHIEIPIIGFNNVYTSSFGRINQSKSLVLNPTCISSFFFFFLKKGWFLYLENMVVRIKLNNCFKDLRLSIFLSLTSLFSIMIT